MPIMLLLLLCCALLPAAEEYWPGIRIRPATWAQPVIGTELENFFKLDDKVYRSEQPGDDEMKMLEANGVKSILNLRDHNSDDDEAKGTKLKLYRVEMNAGGITQQQLIEALRYIHEAPKPIVVHCWHGSDRTGGVCAAYRIVFQGWSKKDAIDELRNGGYGFHARFYENIPELIKSMDVATMKKAVLKTDNKEKVDKKEAVDK